MKYSAEPLFPEWTYQGLGGERQICKIYAKSIDYPQLEEFFGHSLFTLNQQNTGFQFGDNILKCLATNKAIEFEKELARNAGYVRFSEGAKESPQGQFYQGEVKLDPDSDSISRWIQELNSMGKPTIFVVIFSQGGGRVIGNFNSGGVIESKFDAGGKKSSQDREVSYKWQSQHPSFFLEETDVFFPEYFIRAKDLSGNYYTSLATGTSYFNLKFDKTPYNHKFVSGSLYFKVPPDTKIIDTLFGNNAFGFEFEDPTGRIVGVEDSNGVFAGTLLSYVVLTGPIFTVKNVINLATGLDRAEVKNLVFQDGNGGCFQVKRLKAHEVKVVGTLTNSFNDMNQLLIGDKLLDVIVESTGSLISSFQRMGDATATVCPWNNLAVKGLINDSFHDGYHAMRDITVYDLVTAQLTNSFSDSSLMTMRKVYLGYGTNNSFQNCTNISAESIDMNEVASQVGNSWFVNAVNIYIKTLGSTIGADGIADPATSKFTGCTGNFFFKLGYNTINAGGIEGDVANIISSGTPSSINYTL